MKTPDALDRAIENKVNDLDEFDEIKALANRWFKHGEYLTVEIDTESETCTVVPVKDG